MKNFNFLKFLVVILFFATSAFGQALPIRNDSDAVLRDLGANLNVGRNFSVDSSGRIKMGAITPGTGATNLGKAESATHVSGDVGVFSLGVRNTSLGSFAGNGEYSPIATGTNSQVLATIVYDSTLSGTANSPVTREDLPVPTDAGIILTGAKRLDVLATGEVGANLDAAVPIVDTLSRFYVNPWGAAVTEFTNACTGGITDTTQTTIKAAVASNRIYVTSIGCNNSSLVDSTLTFADGTTGEGSTVYWQGAITKSTTIGSYEVNFPTPLRGSSNKAVVVTLGTTATNTRCCLNGFTSPY